MLAGSCGFIWRCPEGRLAAASGGTVLWSCQAGEFVLWAGTDLIFTSNNTSAWTIRDFWQMRDGDFVTITSRWADLPAWFELHPTEVVGGVAVEMKKRLNAGYRPDEQMYGLNVWRAKAGDRLVRVTTRDTSRPVREVLDLRACVLAIGENSPNPLRPFLGSGTPEGSVLPQADVIAMRSGFDAAVGLGVPRVFAPEWKFGA
jgi:hypothetical protein